MSGDSSPDDEALLAAHLAGDPQALEELVARHQTRVYGICLRYFRDQVDAEDAMQETFVALLRKGASFRGGAAFSTWLYRVTTNACNDLARRRARRQGRVAWTTGDAARDGLEATPDPRDELAARELGMELESALRLLDPQSRQAVVLHDVEGLPYADVAVRLDLPIGTVKSRIHRGHARLARALGHLQDAGPAASSQEPSAQPAPPTS